jgi:beta-lactamase class A
VKQYSHIPSRTQTSVLRKSVARPGAVRGVALVAALTLSCLYTAGRLSAQTVPEPIDTLEELASQVAERLSATGAEYGFAYRNLETGAEILLGADTEFHAASMMKVPVMVRLYRMADAGTLDLDAPLPVRNEFTSIYDGSTYSLTWDDDSDSTLYALTDDAIPTRELIDLMIKRSSNLATNILIELADPDSIAVMLEEFGAQGMKVLRGVEDNPTNARGLLELYTALGRGTAASPASTQAMLDILLGQEFNDAIPAGLPAGVPVAHKTGWITEIDHDGGIVFPPAGSPYILVILTRGVEDEAVTRRAAADVSRMVWESTIAAGESSDSE